MVIYKKKKKVIPPKSESNVLLPVEICITFDLICENSVPVMNEAD